MTALHNWMAPPPVFPLNVADRLSDAASATPAAIAIACTRRSSHRYPTSRQGNSGTRYAKVTFEELDFDATRLAHGLLDWGVPPGTRLALLVRPGIEFVSLVFALLRAGMVIVLVDPGLGRRNLIRCLEDVQPDGFVAIGPAHAARLLLRRKFPHARWNVAVGRRWFWGGLTLEGLRSRGNSLLSARASLPTTHADDPAAIIFTSGSTGPPKGVLYTHRMFDTQVAEIQSTYGIEAGAIDLACFPLFALFNAAMGVTTVFPEMDFARPASADPRKLLAAANDWRVTQAFASPAVWRKIGTYCAKSGARIPSLRQVFSCGAPVSAEVLRSTLACAAAEAKMHTPYGATECLPVATIEGAEVLAETAQHTDVGAGVCVGRKFDSIDWRIIRITDEPIGTIDDAEELPLGEIGELIVRGPQTSPAYVTRAEANADAKIVDKHHVWHRMGDVGYLDEYGRFWYCGRKSQRVETSQGTLFTECIEGIFNAHPVIPRSALVGVGPRDNQTPVVIFEATTWLSRQDWTEQLVDLAASCHRPWPIRHYFNVNWRLPVDVRHNVKIDREKLAQWAARELDREQRKKRNNSRAIDASPQPPVTL